MSKRDLGTYYVRVLFADGGGYLDRWETSARYTHGRNGKHPLDAFRIQPTWESEDDLAEIVEYAYRDGNYSCDCNKASFLHDAYQQPEQDDYPCGDEMKLASLTLIRPDGSERPLSL